MYELKTNTAARIVVGPAVDPDDLLAKLSLDVTDISVQICRMAQDGSAVVLSAFTPTASGGDNDMVHISGDTAGMYDLELTASQLNFLGPARIILYDENEFIIHWVDILVLSAAYYDWKYGTTKPEVDLVLIDGEAIDVTEAQLGVNVVEADSVAWEDEERLSKLDAMQENITDIKRVTDNISSSTLVARDNTKISAAAGYAFIDFGDADIFANHIASHSKLTITDSAGKKLMGYLKATGEGETLGDEIVTGTLDAGSYYKIEKEGRTPVFPTDKESSSVSITDSDGEILSTGDIGATPAWTYVVKVVISASGQTYRTLICAGADEDNKSLRLYNGYLQAVQEGTNQSAISTSVATLDDNVEHNLVATFDFNGDKIIRLYMDGEPLTLSTQQALVGDLVTPVDSIIRLGLNDEDYSGTGITYKEAIIYNRALSAAEVADLYANGIADSDKWGSQTPVYASNFSAGVDGWALDSGSRTLAGNIDKDADGAGVPPSNDWLRVTRTAVPGASWAYKATGFPADYVPVAVSAEIYNPPGSLFTHFCFGKGGPGRVTPVIPVSAGTSVTVHRLAIITGKESKSELLYLAPCSAAGQWVSGSEGDAYYVKNVKTYQLGATIALAPEGIRRSKWYDASGNQNDATYSGGVTANIDEYFTSGGTEDCDADNTVKQVLEPDVDGVTITSTPGGDTQDWASVEAGFDFYDAAGYTITLPGNQPDLLYTEKKLMPTNLDTKVSSRSTLTAAQVWANTTRTLSAISDSAGVTTLLSRISQALGFTAGSVNVHVKGKDNLDFSTAEKASLNAATPAVTVSDKTDFALTSAYDAAKTAATQTSVNAIPTTPVLSNDARLDNLDATITSRLADGKYVAPANADIAAIKAKTDNLPASPAAVGSEMTLPAAYDAAKTAASQSSVNSIPTNPLLTTDARLNNLNATIASRLAADNYIAPANDNITAIKAVTDKLDDTLELEDGAYKFTEASLVDAPTGSGSISVEDVVDGVLDAKLSDHEEVGSVGAGIAAAGSAGDPWATELPGSYGNNTAGKIIGDNINATISSRLAATSYTTPPSASDIRTEIDSNSTKLDVSVGTRLATVGYTAPNNTDIGNIKTIADKLDTMLEADGSDYKFTEEALSEAPVASDAPTAIEIRNELDSNSTKLANLDTTISSRLATTSYAAPPTAANIRNEIDTNSIKLDAAISSRLAALDYNSPPTAAQIRNEMDNSSTKLANLDATISSRLAENVYTAPPTVTEIRSEIDSNSTKLDVAISTRLAATEYEAPDNEAIADIKEIADILDSLIEDSDGNRFTAKALEQVPITTLTVTDIVNGVLDEALLSHQQPGSVGAGISAAGSAGDPWATMLPGAYPEGTAGYVMGTNLLNPGTGNNIWLYRLVDEDTTEPIIGALVVASTDIAGNIIIATAVTDARGIVRFNLNSGTYYLWRRHVNYEFTDPDIEVVP